MAPVHAQRSSSHKRGAKPRKTKRRFATVYDAVAGRLGYQGVLAGDRTSKNRDTKSSTSQAVPPEEVLSRRKGAPQRFEEYDIYFANERLAPNQSLPDSDLLKLLHTYAAHFYRHATFSKGRRDYRSMDETALLALGILMEEAAREVVGATGDLALTEGDDADSGAIGRTYWNGRKWMPSVLRRRDRQ